MAKEIMLKVKEAYKDDAGRGIVRLGSGAFEELDLASGDAVLLKGSKEAVGLAWRMKQEEEGVVRIDSVIRHNAGAGIDEEVSVSKVDCKPAQEIKLAPNQPIRFGQDFVDYVAERIMNMPLMKGNSIVIEIMGRSLPLTVANVKPSGIVRVDINTSVSISEKPVKIAGVGISYEDIGGLRNEIEAVREMIEIPMKHPEVFKKLGISPPKGVLLYGPPGCGKTLLAKALANETDAAYFSINGPEIISKFYGQSEENLRGVFEEASKSTPAIIFIDEVDAIAPKREEVTGEVEKRVVSQLLTLMDGLEARGDVVVIAATNREDSIDPALRRPGRFDREIAINAPDRKGRLEILQIHSRGMPMEEELDLEHFAAVTYGFTGADLASLTKEAAMKALKRAMPDIKKAGDVPLSKTILDNLEVTRRDFEDALSKVEPSAMREVRIEVPNVGWEDVGGLEDVKQKITEAVEWPLKFPEMFESVGIDAPRGLLLYGPPGCGKTLLAKAVANESNANFITIRGPELMSKWVGESERGVRLLFRRARQVAPSIIFFDEIDSLAGFRTGAGTDSGVGERVVAQLLTEIDGVSDLKNVVLIGATNRPDLLDPALLRPGRLDSQVFVPFPDLAARKKILSVHTRRMKLDKNVDLAYLAKKTEHYTGADLSALCREAGMFAVRQGVRSKKPPGAVTKEHFEKALEKIKSSVSKEDEDRWSRIHQRMSGRVKDAEVV